MFPILFTIGKIHLYSYGFFIGLGLFVASYFFMKKANSYGYQSSNLENTIFFSFLSGIIGARLLYVLLNFSYFTANPSEIVKFWEGGLVFIGGFLFAFTIGILLLRKYKYPIVDVLDIAAPFIILGHSIGRIGCFSAGCCYGKETNSIFGVVFQNPNCLAPLNIKIHPTQLYESVGNFVIFLILLKILNKRQFKGQVIGAYLLLYSMFRFFVEFFRADDRGAVYIFSVTQGISIVMFFLGVIILYYGYKKRQINS